MGLRYQVIEVETSEGTYVGIRQRVTGKWLPYGVRDYVSRGNTAQACKLSMELESGYQGPSHYAWLSLPQCKITELDELSNM